MTEDTTPAAAERAAADPQTGSRWEDYVDVLVSPKELFARRAHDRLLPPMLTLGVATLIVSLLMIPVNAGAIRAGTAGSPEAEQFMEQWGTLLNVIGAVISPLFVLMIVVWAGALLWLGSRLLSIDVSFRQTVLIATYAGFLYLFGQLLRGGLTMLAGPDLDPVRDTSLGVLRFTGTDAIAPALVPLLGRLDLFVIWQAVVWAIGLAVIGRAAFARAGAAAALACLLYALPAVIFAALGIGQGPPTPAA